MAKFEKLSDDMFKSITLGQYMPDKIYAQSEAIKNRQPIRLSGPYFELKAGEYEWITNIGSEEVSKFPFPLHVTLKAFDANGNPIPKEEKIVSVYRYRQPQQ